MGKRGRKPENKVKIIWSPNFAYAIGLIVTDGCLSSDGRHINLTSKDIEQIENFKLALGVNNVVGKKSSGSEKEKKYYTVQFGDVLFYRFLNSIGITSAKSLTIESVKVPDRYFFDFLRGVFDGDGYSFSYWDKRWKSSYMIYIGFASASRVFIDWLRRSVSNKLMVKGHVTATKRKNYCYQLKYSKHEAIEIFKKMYYSNTVMCLSRKRLKINKSLDIVGDSLC